MLYYIISYYITLYYIILYYIILHYIIRYSNITNTSSYEIKFSILMDVIVEMYVITYVPPPPTLACSAPVVPALLIKRQ